MAGPTTSGAHTVATATAFAAAAAAIEAVAVAAEGAAVVAAAAAAAAAAVAGGVTRVGQATVRGCLLGLGCVPLLPVPAASVRLPPLVPTLVEGCTPPATAAAPARLAGAMLVFGWMVGAWVLTCIKWL